MSEATGWPDSGTSMNWRDGCNSRMRATISGREEVAFGTLEFEDGAADLRPLLPEQGDFPCSEAAVDPEKVGVLLGDVLASVVEAQAVLGGVAVVVG